jgi:class 3 adenylate cyclase
MELMEDLDPEEARAIVDPALKLMMDAVHRYGGFVVQSTGDGIFALFGALVAHEDLLRHALNPFSAKAFLILDRSAIPCHRNQAKIEFSLRREGASLLT